MYADNTLARLTSFGKAYRGVLPAPMWLATPARLT